MRGQPVRLLPWQKDELRRIFDNPHGTRRAILSFGRKNGKTALAAMLLLVFLCGPLAQPNGQLYSAAQSREQAAVLFNLAAKMVRMSPDLVGIVGIRDTAKELYFKALGTKYRALSADASTAYGLSPYFIVHDELGQVRGPRSELYEALETATAAQEAPLSIVISTQAPTDGDLLSILIDDALTGADPRTLCALYAADESLDPFSVEAIRAANPGLGTLQNEREVMDMAEAARRMPTKEAEFRNLILNQRVESTSPFITKSLWQACGGEVVSKFTGAVYGGLDLSEVRDLTAMVLISQEKDGLWHVKPTFWFPEEGIRERSAQDRVPYDVWAREGFLQLTPGAAVDYDYVAGEVRKVFVEYKFKIGKFGFDRWNWRHFEPWLKANGFKGSDLKKFQEVGMGMVTMSPALRALEEVILNKLMAHGGHPVLTMCMANARVTRDTTGSRKLDKLRSRGRIDGAVALAIAMAVAGEDGNKLRDFSIKVV